MVKILEIKTSEFVDLKKIREYKPAVEKDRQYQNIVYMCDCDTFGGGDPPCYNSK